MDKILGREATISEIENWRNLKFPNVYFLKEKRIILPEEFFNKKGPESLYWKQLAEIKSKSDTNGEVFCNNFGIKTIGFDGLFETLFEELVKQGKMTANYPKIEDYLIQDDGIGIIFSCGFDHHGRNYLGSKGYFPKIFEDAREYARHFKSGIVRITQIKDNVKGEKKY
jgi:hypothetical protein